MPNYKWPQTETNNCVPWWIIVLRLVGMTIAFPGICVATTGIFIGYGTYEAKRFFNNAF